MNAARGDAGIASFVQSRALADGALVEVGELVPTLEASRFGLEALATLGSGNGGPVRHAAAELVRACRRPSGGFAMKADDAGADLAGTYYAMRLIASGLVDAEPEAEALGGWVREAALVGGEWVSVDVDELYYAVRALELGATLPDDAAEAVRGFVGRCAAPGGGFGLMPGAEPDIERTYCCLHMLQLLGAPRVGEAHRDWIRSAADEEHVYWDASRGRCSPATMYWGARAAEIAGVELSWAGLERGIEAFRHSGGGYALDGEPSLWLTYCGARTAALARRAGSGPPR